MKPTQNEIRLTKLEKLRFIKYLHQEIEMLEQQESWYSKMGMNNPVIKRNIDSVKFVISILQEGLKKNGI